MWQINHDDSDGDYAGDDDKDDNDGNDYNYDGDDDDNDDNDDEDNDDIDDDDDDDDDDDIDDDDDDDDELSFSRNVKETLSIFSENTSRKRKQNRWCILMMMIMMVMMTMINYRSIETWRKCYLFFSESTTRSKIIGLFWLR